jgi:formylglycine-generating enzyme
MYWMRRVYGVNSNEYLATKPDSNVWIDKEDSCAAILTKKYLRHPAYDYYPLVGISQEQANNYSQWRSDRVFEMMLIRAGKIKPNSKPTEDSHFTIERYFSGKYQNVKPDTNFRFYPEYRLPTYLEWKKALFFSDSVGKAFLKKCNNKYCKTCKAEFPKIVSDIVVCQNDTLVIPTIPVRMGCPSNKKYRLYHLRGNVSEWLSETYKCSGGGWTDQKQKILVEDIVFTQTVNAWTGFRNVCEWKEFKIVSH